MFYFGLISGKLIFFKVVCRSSDEFPRFSFVKRVGFIIQVQKQKGSGRRPKMVLMQTVLPVFEKSYDSTTVRTVYGTTSTDESRKSTVQ